MAVHQLTPRHTSLPSEGSLFRELVRELGLYHPGHKDDLRRNLKKKYSEQIGLVCKNMGEFEKFEEKREKELLQREKKLREFKESLVRKQDHAKKIKQAALKDRNKRASDQSQKWQQVVKTNHREYAEALDNSLIMVRKWEDKGFQSSSRKSLRLEEISKRSQEHNTYVNEVAVRNRELLSQESEKRIAGLNSKSHFPMQQSLKRKSSLSRNGVKKGEPISKNHRSLLFRQSPPLSPLAGLNIHKKQQKLPKISNSNAELNRSGRSLNFSRNTSKASIIEHRRSRLEAKRVLDEEEMQQSLCKNISKQQKIQQARNLKKYLHQNRNKQNQQKSTSLLKKLENNRRNLELADQQRKRQLDIKFRQNRSRGVSLPIIRNQADRHGDDSSQIYLTAVSSEDNSQKYNRAILDKLRSISITVNQHRKCSSKFL